MSDEHFYGITLSGNNKSETWNPETEDPIANTLVIKQALLGPEAAPDELNVVQVETISHKQPIIIPLVILKIGEARQVRLDIEFPNAPVTFRLVQGVGPVHLMGQHTLIEQFDDLEDIEDALLDEADGDPLAPWGDQ